MSLGKGELPMSAKIRIPHGGMVLVSDGRKALFLKNQGDDLYPNLQVEQVLQAPDNPQTQQQGTDRPGRASMLGRRSAVDQTDWHDIAERKFAGEVAEVVNAACAAGAAKAIVIAAPPRTLAELRSRLSEAAQRRIVAEVNKDLTKHPVYEIEQHLT
jgi:protein required for attachment to host cells